MKLPKNNTGFTLIELLVTIAIIGVLTAVLLANMVGIRERGRDTALKSDLKQLKTALRIYYNDNQGYPVADGSCAAVLGGGGDTFDNGGSTIYMRDMPPSDTDVDCQYFSNNSETFNISVKLRNTADSDIQESMTRCGILGSPAGRYYECTD